MSDDMRRLLSLMESDEDVRPLRGSLDIKGLAEFLPDVSDQRRFMSAMVKVRRGRIESLTMQERGQLALAFVSILRDEREDKMKIMRKLMQVRAS